MPAILDAISTAPPTEQAAGVALICDHALTASPLAEGCTLGGCEADIYAGIAAAILRYSHLGVVLQARDRARKAAYRAAVDRVTELLPDAPGRLRMIEAEKLEGLLRGVDLLVSFASPRLIEGCKNGLKPVQIGRAVKGSAAFSHVFPGIADFAEALAAGRLTGGLSLQEYQDFEEFCRRLTRRGAAVWSLAGARWLAEDAIVRACRPPNEAWHLAVRTVASAITNPFAAWHLLRAGFRATAAR